MEANAGSSFCQPRNAIQIQLDRLESMVRRLLPNNRISLNHPPQEGNRSGSIQLKTGSVKKPRLTWTPDLHQKFCEAVEELGPQEAIPKNIKKQMEQKGVQGITRLQIGSHLQNYRKKQHPQNCDSRCASGSNKFYGDESSHSLQQCLTASPAFSPNFGCDAGVSSHTLQHVRTDSHSDELIGMISSPAFSPGFGLGSNKLHIGEPSHTSQQVFSAWQLAELIGRISSPTFVDQTSMQHCFAIPQPQEFIGPHSNLEVSPVPVDQSNSFVPFPSEPNNFSIWMAELLAGNAITGDKTPFYLSDSNEHVFRSFMGPVSAPCASYETMNDAIPEFDSGTAGSSS